MKTTIRAGFVLIMLTASALLPALPVSASTAGSWTVSQTHYTIYFDGGYATMYFSKPPTTLPNNGQITSTSVQVNPYTNGRTTETITICYQKVYTTTDYLCTVPVAITGSTTFPVANFNGQDPKGKVTVKHTLYGGTYLTTGGGIQDTVTVNYQY